MGGRRIRVTRSGGVGPKRRRLKRPGAGRELMLNAVVDKGGMAGKVGAGAAEEAVGATNAEEDPDRR